MANIAPSMVLVHPNFMEPGIIMPYSQASGAFETLPSGAPEVKLGGEDLYVYVRRVDLRTRAAAGQAAYNLLPSIATAFTYISTPTYLLRVRGEYDHHDTAAVGEWGQSIVELQRLGMFQAHFQLLRTALLYGMNPANGEGLLNAAGASTINLPADTNGNTTVVTYDNGQMAFFLIGQVSAMKTRTNQLGIGRKFVFLGPQRVLGTFEYQDIVQLTQWQRVGGGTQSTAGVVKAIAEDNDDEVIWVYDDTLIGKGAGGNDAVLLVMPEIENPQPDGTINTNIFGNLAPGILETTKMYLDMAAPREIPTPLAGGAIDTLTEIRSTSGWPLRPEAVTIMSMQYQ